MKDRIRSVFLLMKKILVSSKNRDEKLFCVMSLFLLLTQMFCGRLFFQKFFWEQKSFFLSLFCNKQKRESRLSRQYSMGFMCMLGVFQERRLTKLGSITLLRQIIPFLRWHNISLL